MENVYAAQVALLDTDKLLRLLQAREEYEPEIVLAVIAELQLRNVEVADLEEIRSYAEAVYNAKLEQENQPKTPAEKVKDFLQIFVPQSGYFITPILLNINLFVFIVMVLAGIHFLTPDAGQLFAIGANYGPYTLSGDWWRLLTSTFIHGGIVHLLLNMLALVSVGRQLELMIGRVPFLIAYILCGLSGSLASVWWDGTRVSVGASGAIFGMFGLLLVLMALERKLTWPEKRAMLGNLGIVIGINLMYGMTGGIDNAAHTGGLVAGILIGAILMLRSDRQIAHNFSLSGNAILAVSGLLLLTIVYNLVPFTGQMRYLYTLDQVAQKEAEAIKVLVRLSEKEATATAEEFAPQLEAGIKLWDEGEVLLEEINDIEGKDQDRVLVMLDYVRLRKKSFEMLRDDLLHNRPLLNPQQQQVLGAINGYLTALQQGKESEVVDPMYRERAEMPEITMEDEEEASSVSDTTHILLVIDKVKIGVVEPGAMAEQLSGIDKNNISDVTVLKGEAARALYGEEGANGAIIITTKKVE